MDVFIPYVLLIHYDRVRSFHLFPLLHGLSRLYKKAYRFFTTPHRVPMTHTQMRNPFFFSIFGLKKTIPIGNLFFFAL